LKTCLTNLNSQSFFENVSQEISGEKVLSVLDTIRNKMQYKKMTCKSLFEKCDTEKSGMMNLAQFIVGVNSIVPIASPLLEKLFQKMDTNKIGMVDEQKLVILLSAKVKTQIPRISKIEDSFEWQENVIDQIKNWVKSSKMNAEEAFKSFDQDFDGLISKADMSKSLIQFLKIKPEDLNEPKLERLFRLLSFYKTDSIQPSDFERLVNDVNPYLTASTS
jgi:Ca2+-binding EF-hand superfamily protein